MIVISAGLMACAIIHPDSTVKVMTLCFSCLTLIVAIGESEDRQKQIDDDE